MKNFSLLLFLLNFGAANAGIASTLMHPIRAFYDGPFTGYALNASGILEDVSQLPKQYVAEVEGVLKEMGLDPARVRLFMHDDEEEVECDERHAGYVKPELGVGTCGSAIIFSRDFFENTPKEQRRGVIGHESCHIHNCDSIKSDLLSKAIPTALAIGTSITCGTLAYTKLPISPDTYIQPKLGRVVYDLGTTVWREILVQGYWRKKTTNEIWWDRIGATLIFATIPAFLIGLISHAIGDEYNGSQDVNREQSADLESARILGCAREAADYFEKERQENIATRYELPQKFIIDSKGRIRTSSLHMDGDGKLAHDPDIYFYKSYTPDDIYDAQGNYRLDTAHPRLSDRVLYLRELAKEQSHGLS